ncbi:flavo protein [Peniophora sp. CONT]|nr:flavo protein [Peniophora sp. CONT]
MLNTSRTEHSSPKRLFTAQSTRREGFTHVLLMTTGSVASVKAPLIVEELLTYENVAVEVVATKASLTFFDPASVRKLGVNVWVDEDEWLSDYKIGDPILHIELRRWADVVLVAPCSANTLAKIAGGLCDNLATSLLRALSPETSTFLYPAMNTLMYQHPLTARHLDVIREVIGYTVVGPISKGLACGDVGVGAMVEWRDIVAAVAKKFALTKRAAQ